MESSEPWPRATPGVGEGNTGFTSSHAVNQEASQNIQVSTFFENQSVGSVTENYLSNNLSSIFPDDNTGPSASDDVNSATNPNGNELSTWKYLISYEGELLPKKTVPDGWRGHTAAQLADMVFDVNMDLSHLSEKRFSKLMGTHWEEAMEGSDANNSIDPDAPGAIWDLVPVHHTVTFSDWLQEDDSFQKSTGETNQIHNVTRLKFPRGGRSEADVNLGGRNAIRANTPVAWANFVRANQASR